MAFVMETVNPSNRRVQGEKALMVMDVHPEDPNSLTVRPADWLYADANEMR